MIDKAKAREFLAACIAEGIVTQRGAESCTRRWSDRAMRAQWLRLSGNRTVSEITKPPGSIPLKEAIYTICEAVRLSYESVYGQWKRGRLPLVPMRKLKTRVDVDPASVPSAVEFMRVIKGVQK